MNTNKIYLVNVYIKTSSEKISGIELYHEKADFIKKALVYDRTAMFEPYYVDLATRRKYYIFQLSDAEVGELFINMKQGLIPLENIIEINQKNMSRRRILKKYNDNIKNTKNNNNNNNNK